MNFDWILLAEGIGQDAKGALTAIGINQNVLFAGKLPTITRRAVIAHFVDSGRKLKMKTDFAFEMNVISPSDAIVVTQKLQGQFDEGPLNDVPVGVDLPIQFVIPVHEYGDYRITVLLKVEDMEARGETVLHVRPLPSSP